MRAGVAAIALIAVGCASEHSVGHDDRADVAGDYTLALTSGPNGCQFDGWMEGGTATVPLSVVQAGAEVSATVGGPAALLVGLLYSSATYVGRVDGHLLDMAIHGKSSKRAGNCIYTMKSVVRATGRGDFLVGTVKHQSSDNGSSDCAAIRCSSDQSFNGSRPPRL